VEAGGADDGGVWCFALAPRLLEDASCAPRNADTRELNDQNRNRGCEDGAAGRGTEEGLGWGARGCAKRGAAESGLGTGVRSCEGDGTEAETVLGPLT